MIDPLGESRQLTISQWYGLAVMRVLIAQNRRDAARGSAWYPEAEAEYQAALRRYQLMQKQTPWWAMDYIHNGLRILVTPDGRIAQAPCAPGSV